jgi:hypothetical protein
MNNIVNAKFINKQKIKIFRSNDITEVVELGDHFNIDRIVYPDGPNNQPVETNYPNPLKIIGFIGSGIIDDFCFGIECIDELSVLPAKKHNILFPNSRNFDQNSEFNIHTMKVIKNIMKGAGRRRRTRYNKAYKNTRSKYNRRR